MQELLEKTEDRHQENKEEVIAAIAATLKKYEKVGNNRWIFRQS